LKVKEEKEQVVWHTKDIVEVTPKAISSDLDLLGDCVIHTVAQPRSQALGSTLEKQCWANGISVCELSVGWASG
jgi:hypothetical protein